MKIQMNESLSLSKVQNLNKNEIIEELTKREIDFAQSETFEVLRTRLREAVRKELSEQVNSETAIGGKQQRLTLTKIPWSIKNTRLRQTKIMKCLIASK